MCVLFVGSCMVLSVCLCVIVVFVCVSMCLCILFVISRAVLYGLALMIDLLCGRVFCLNCMCVLCVLCTVC